MIITKKFSPKRGSLASLQFDAVCFNCKFDETFKLQLDHHVPRAHGENRTTDRLVTLCETCNKIKGSLLPDKFYSPEQIAEIEMRFQKQFTELEVFIELRRLIEQAKGFYAKFDVPPSESLKRADKLKSPKFPNAIYVPTKETWAKGRSFSTMLGL